MVEWCLQNIYRLVPGSNRQMAIEMSLVKLHIDCGLEKKKLVKADCSAYT